MAKQVVVSVIVPCYNQAQYVGETLQSVLDQTYPHWECIVVNDGSPDNTREVLAGWLQKDERFKYLEKENGGISSARNAGIRRAVGQFILPLDSDDKIAPSYMEEAMKVFSAQPEVKLVYSKARLFGEKNKKWRLAPYSYREMLLKNMVFCSCFYRKSDFDLTEGYAEYMKTAWEDWEFLIRFLQPSDKVVRLNRYHFFYRIKKQSRSSAAAKGRNSQLYLELFKRHQELYLRYLNPIKDYREYIYKVEKKAQKRARLLQQVKRLFGLQKR